MENNILFILSHLFSSSIDLLFIIFSSMRICMLHQLLTHDIIHFATFISS